MSKQLDRVEVWKWWNVICRNAELGSIFPFLRVWVWCRCPVKLLLWSFFYSLILTRTPSTASCWWFPPLFLLQPSPWSIMYIMYFWSSAPELMFMFTRFAGVWSAQSFRRGLARSCCAAMCAHSDANNALLLPPACKKRDMCSCSGLPHGPCPPSRTIVQQQILATCAQPFLSPRVSWIRFDASGK